MPVSSRNTETPRKNVLPASWAPLSSIKWIYKGFPVGSDGKQFAYNAGDWASIPGWEDPLEKGMAIHSSILAWRIPWTEELGGL